MASGRRVEAVGHERDVGALEGDVGAGGAHRDPDARGGERGRVVDAVADHRDRAGLAFELVTCSSFSAGSRPAWTSSMPAARGDGAGDGLGVAGEHHDAVDAGRAQASARPAASARGLVGEAEQREQRGRPRRARSPSRPRLVQPRERGRRACRAVRCISRGPPAHSARPSTMACGAAARERHERSAGGTGRPRSARGAAQRGGERCSEPARRRRRARAPRRSSVGVRLLQLREAERQRAGLVQRDRADARRDPRAPGRP